MAISNWNARAIIDHLYDQLNAAKADIGLKMVSKGLRMNISDEESVRKFVANAQQPFLYLSLVPGNLNAMEHETEAAIETRIKVGCIIFLSEDKSAGLLQERIDILVEKLLDFVVSRDEFRGGLATEVFPAGYISTEESLFPDAFIRVDFDFAFSWIKG